MDRKTRTETWFGGYSKLLEVVFWMGKFCHVLNMKIKKSSFLSF